MQINLSGRIRCRSPIRPERTVIQENRFASSGLGFVRVVLRDLFRIGLGSGLLLISSCALIGPTNESNLRLVRVKALADTSLRRENPQWEVTLRGLLSAASDYFEDEFGIRLVVTSIGPWDPAKSSTSTRVLLSQLMATYSVNGSEGDTDLIIAFTGKKVDVYGVGLARADRLGNCTDGLGNYIVSSSSEPFRYRGKESQFEWDALALIHELGHVFGATHTDETQSIMHRQFAHRSRFDFKNKETIRSNKFCPFHKP